MVNAWKFIALEVDRGDFSMGRYQVITREACPWTIVGKVFGELYASCTLTTSFIDVAK
jgi:hypothetical protein